MRFLLAAFLGLLLAPAASAAECAALDFSTAYPLEIDNAIQACSDQLLQASKDLDSADPAAKKKAAQQLVDAQKIVDDWGKAAKAQSAQCEADWEACKKSPVVLHNNYLQLDAVAKFSDEQQQYADDLTKARSIIDSAVKPAAPNATPQDSTPNGGQKPADNLQSPPSGDGAVAPDNGSSKTRAQSAAQGAYADAGSSSGGSGGGKRGGGGDNHAPPEANVGNGAAIGKLGSDLKKAFDDGGRVAAAEMKAGPGSAMGSFAPGAKAGRGPAAASDANLALAAGPFAEDFKKNGLKVAIGPDGKPLIVDQSGRPAGETEKQRLTADIRAEPAALAHDQNFFTPARGGISREDFNALKDTYRKDPAGHDADFKHIVLTPPGEDKDFVRSQSCELVSGECNPHAKKSYAKGETVPAGDLGRILAALRDRLLSADGRHERARASRVGGRIGGWMGGLASFFGSGGASSGDAASGAEAENSPGGGSAARADGGARAGGGQPGGGAAPLAGGAKSSSTGGSGLTPARLALFLAGTAGTFLLLGAAYVLFKRDRPSWNR